MRRILALAPVIILGLTLPGSPRVGDPAPQEAKAERSFAFTYRMVARDIPRGARHLTLWIPLPRETPAQRVEDLEIRCDLPHRIVKDPVYGNYLLFAQAEEELPEEVTVDVSFVVHRKGYQVLQGMRIGDVEIHPADLERFLQPDRLVPIDGPIAERARRAVAGKTTTLEKARAIYEDVLRTMKYDKSGSGWGRGDALYACDVGRGNCTDFHSLFIGMCRASGIPARFVIGFPVPSDTSAGTITGYHCWAEFYDEELGWVPVDASEAWKHPEKRDFLFGGLDPNRVEFTMGRDIPLVPEDEAPAEPVNYLIYPLVYVDGQPYQGVVKEFRFRDVESDG
jgi:transglutaminase-like putative cysteine protease